MLSPIKHQYCRNNLEQSLQKERLEAVYRFRQLDVFAILHRMWQISIHINITTLKLKAHLSTARQALDKCRALCQGGEGCTGTCPPSPGARLVPPGHRYQGLAIQLFLHPLCSLLMLSYIIYNHVSNGRGFFFLKN
jgi:hypothetical protein